MQIWVILNELGDVLELCSTSEIAYNSVLKRIEKDNKDEEEIKWAKDVLEKSYAASKDSFNCDIYYLVFKMPVNEGNETLEQRLAALEQKVKQIERHIFCYSLNMGKQSDDDSYLD